LRRRGARLFTPLWHAKANGGMRSPWARQSLYRLLASPVMRSGVLPAPQERDQHGKNAAYRTTLKRSCHDIGGKTKRKHRGFLTSYLVRVRTRNECIAHRPFIFGRFCVWQAPSMAQDLPIDQQLRRSRSPTLACKAAISVWTPLRTSMPKQHEQWCAHAGETRAQIGGLCPSGYITARSSTWLWLGGWRHCCLWSRLPRIRDGAETRPQPDHQQCCMARLCHLSLLSLPLSIYRRVMRERKPIGFHPELSLPMGEDSPSCSRRHWRCPLSSADVICRSRAVA